MGSPNYWSGNWWGQRWWSAGGAMNAPLTSMSQVRAFHDTADLYRVTPQLGLVTGRSDGPLYTLAASSVRCRISDKPIDDERSAVGGIRGFSRRVATQLTVAFGQEVESGWRVYRHARTGVAAGWFVVLGDPSFSPFPPGGGNVNALLQPLLKDPT